MTVEGAGQVGPGQLARVCIWAKDVSWAVVGSVDLGDLAGRRISNQLQQRNSTVFWKERKKKKRQTSKQKPQVWVRGVGCGGWGVGGDVMLDQVLLDCWCWT